MTIEEAKDQVAKKYGYPKWTALWLKRDETYLAEAIELFGKEMYNQGVRDAAENAKAFCMKEPIRRVHYLVDKESVLKLIKE